MVPMQGHGLDGEGLPEERALAGLLGPEGDGLYSAWRLGSAAGVCPL